MAKKRRVFDMSNFDPHGPQFDGGGGGAHFPPGDYRMSCKQVEDKISSKGNDMWEFQFTGVEGKSKGKTLYYHVNMDNQQKNGHAWRAVGQDPTGNEEFEPDVDAAEGVEVIATIIDDEYNGQKRSKIQSVAPIEDEEEEEEPKRKRNGKAKKVVKFGEDEIQGMDEEELDDLVTTHDLDVDLAKSKTLPKKRNAVVSALADKDLLAP